MRQEDERLIRQLDISLQHLQREKSLLARDLEEITSKLQETEDLLYDTSTRVVQDSLQVSKHLLYWQCWPNYWCWTSFSEEHEKFYNEVNKEFDQMRFSWVVGGMTSPCPSWRLLPWSRRLRDDVSSSNDEEQKDMMVLVEVASKVVVAWAKFHLRVPITELRFPEGIQWKHWKPFFYFTKSFPPLPMIFHGRNSLGNCLRSSYY